MGGRIITWAVVWAASIAWAGTSWAGGAAAREALQVLEVSLGAQMIPNVVAMAGFNGDDQPEAWRILVKDAAIPDVLQEFVVSGGKVTSRNEIKRADYTDLPDKSLLAGLWRVDSTEAYRIADDEAILAGISFVRLHYQLRFRGADPSPTWLLTFVDAAGGEQGQVVIDSGDGSIAYRNFPSVASADPAVTGAAVEPPAAPGNPVYSTRPVRLRNLFTGGRGRKGRD